MFGVINDFYLGLDGYVFFNFVDLSSYVVMLVYKNGLFFREGIYYGY